jgi:hypothetical protein
MASIRGSGTATLNALLKPGVASGKLANTAAKTRSSIIKNAVKSSIKLGKPQKYAKVAGVKPMSLSANVVDPQYHASMGTFLTGQMQKAKQNFMGHL